LIGFPKLSAEREVSFTEFYSLRETRLQIFRAQIAETFPNVRVRSDHRRDAINVCLCFLQKRKTKPHIRLAEQFIFKPEIYFRAGREIF
jgi:hypothetical protein